MSQVASVYILHKKDLDVLISLPKPMIKRSLFSKKVIDPFPEFLSTYAKEYASIDMDGYLFGVYISLLMEKGIVLEDLELDKKSQELNKIRDPNFVLIATKSDVNVIGNSFSPDRFSIDELRSYFLEFMGDEFYDEVPNELNKALGEIDKRIRLIDDNTVVIIEVG